MLQIKPSKRRNILARRSTKVYTIPIKYIIIITTNILNFYDISSVSNVDYFKFRTLKWISSLSGNFNKYYFVNSILRFMGILSLIVL